MGNPFLELEPNKVSRDLGSYVIYIYGSAKVGKSRFAADFPNSVFLATEPTQRAIPGAFLMDIASWSEMKKAIRNLKDDEVKNRFKTVIIDTVDLAVDYCVQYICSQNGVADISDIAWGKGYALVKSEFEKAVNDIHKLGYGLVMISHVTDSTFTREDGTEYNKVVPSIGNKKCFAVAENIADIYGWAHIRHDEDGEAHRVLTIRQENDSVSGGNHFKYLKSEIPLSYNALTEAIDEAISMEEKEMGKEFFTEKRNIPESTELDFDDLMDQFKKATATIHNNVNDDEWQNIWGPKISSIVEKYLGRGNKISNATASQVEQIDLIVSDLLEEIGNGL